MKSNHSIKFRLGLFISGVSIVLLSIAFAYMYYFLHQMLQNEAHQLVADRFLLIQNVIEEEKDSVNPINGLKDRIEKEWVDRQNQLVWVQITSSSGEVLVRSPNWPHQILQDGWTEDRKMVIPYKDHSEEVHVKIVADRTRGSEFLISYASQAIFVSIVVILISVILIIRIISKELSPLIELGERMKRFSFNSKLHDVDGLIFPSELKPFEESFRTMLKHLQSSYEQLSRFSSDIAHELRTPLNALMIKVEVTIQKKRNLVEYQSLLVSILNDCRDLAGLIDTLLFLARVDSPQMEIKKEWVNLLDELKCLVEFYEPFASEKKINLRLASNYSSNLRVEKQLFKRAIANVIQNSIQYCHSGCVIELYFYEVEGGVHIIIQDNGPGISENHLPHIFERLYRVESSRNNQSGGWGLGLAIVESILKIHGGTVQVQSQIGLGTALNLFFPFS